MFDFEIFDTNYGSPVILPQKPRFWFSVFLAIRILVLVWVVSKALVNFEKT